MGGAVPGLVARSCFTPCICGVQGLSQLEVQVVPDRWRHMSRQCALEHAVLRHAAARRAAAWRWPLHLPADSTQPKGWSMKVGTGLPGVLARLKQLLRTTTRYPACCAAQQLLRGAHEVAEVAAGAQVPHCSRASMLGLPRQKLVATGCETAVTRGNASRLRNQKVSQRCKSTRKAQGTCRTFPCCPMGSSHIP